MKHRLLKSLTSLILVLIMVASLIPAIPISIGAAGTATLSFTGGSGTNGEYTFTDDASGVTAAFTAGTHSTKPRLDTGCIRFYGTSSASNKLTISAPAGATITSITFTMNGSYKLTAVSSNSGTINTTTNIWTGSAESVEFTSTAQTRIEAATITYSGGSTETTTPNPETPSCEHTNIENVTAKDATCTAEGNIAYSYCPDCETYFNENNEVITQDDTVLEMIAHTYVDGICSVCNEKQPSKLTITRDEFGDASGYAWHSWTATTTTGESIRGSGYIYGTTTASIQMNGSKDGDYIYNTTALPGKIVSVTLTKASGTNRNFDVLTSDTPFDSATTASLKGQATDAKKLITETGVTWTFETQHKYFAIVIVDSSAAYLSIEIVYEVCNHTNTTSYDAKDATCTEDGHSAYEVCNDCGKTIGKDLVSNLGGHKDINPVDSRCDECNALMCTDHKWIDDLDNVIAEGDCTTDRVVAQKCENCGEPNPENKTYTAPGHTEEEIPAVAPSCTEDGSTAGKKCSVCDEILVNPEVDPATGHNYVNGVCSCGQKEPSIKVGDLVYFTASGQFMTGISDTSTTYGNISTDFKQAIIFEVKAGLTPGTYAFYSEGNGYISWPKGNNSIAWNTGDLNDNSSWYISEDSTGMIISTSVENKDDYGAIAYNKANTRFATYKNTTISNSEYPYIQAATLPKITSFGLTLNKGVTIRVNINIHGSWFDANAGAQIVFTNGDEVIEKDAAKGANVYTVDLNPTQINNVITVKLVDANGNVIIGDTDVSVATYAEKVTSNEKLTALINAVKKYGIYADSYAHGSASDNLSKPEWNGEGEIETTGENIFKTLGASLTKSASVRLGLDIADVTGYTVSVTIKDHEVVTGQVLDQKQLVLNGIYPANFDDVIVVTVANETKTSTISFTFNAYLKALYENSSTSNKLKNLIVATYEYGVAANIYAAQ